MIEEKSMMEVTLDSTNHILCRQINLVLKDGIEISKTYHRASLYPGQIPDMSLFSGEVSEEDENNILKAVEVYHTETIIQKYQDSMNQEM